MRKLVVFNGVTVDGYFTDKNGDMSWAHKDDPEWNAFVSGNAKGEVRTMFDGMKERLTLKRTKTRDFENGNVLLCYEPLR